MKNYIVKTIDNVFEEMTKRIGSTATDAGPFLLGTAGVH